MSEPLFRHWMPPVGYIEVRLNQSLPHDGNVYAIEVPQGRQPFAHCRPCAEKFAVQVNRRYAFINTVEPCLLDAETGEFIDLHPPEQG